jgi:hypothetical protein
MGRSDMEEKKRGKLTQGQTCSSHPSTAPSRHNSPA